MIHFLQNVDDVLSAARSMGEEAYVNTVKSIPAAILAKSSLNLVDFRRNLAKFLPKREQVERALFERLRSTHNPQKSQAQVAKESVTRDLSQALERRAAERKEAERKEAESKQAESKEAESKEDADFVDAKGGRDPMAILDQVGRRLQKKPAHRVGSVRGWSTEIAPIYEMVEINPNQLFPGRAMYRLGVEGEGSCGYHSFLLATMPAYRELYAQRNKPAYKRLVHEFRCGIGKQFESVEAWHQFIAGEQEETPHAGSFRGVSQKELTVRDINDVVERFCDISVWADEPQLRHMANVLGVNLVAFDVDMGRLFCGTLKGERYDRPLFVMMWVKRTHFELGTVVERLEVQNEEVKVHFRSIFRPNVPWERAVIDHIFDRFDETCPCARSSEPVCTL